MENNLNSLRDKMQGDLESRGMVVFHGLAVPDGKSPSAYWDTMMYPDHRDFVAAAQALGVRLVRMFAAVFERAQADELLEALEDSPLGPEESRPIGKRLREMRAYDGFICAVDLSFDYEGRTYRYHVGTPWYNEFSDLRESITGSDGDDGEDDEDDVFDGPYSRN